MRSKFWMAIDCSFKPIRLQSLILTTCYTISGYWSSHNAFAKNVSIIRRIPEMSKQKWNSWNFSNASMILIWWFMSILEKPFNPLFLHLSIKMKWWWQILLIKFCLIWFCVYLIQIRADIACWFFPNFEVNFAKM